MKKFLKLNFSLNRKNNLIKTLLIKTVDNVGINESLMFDLASIQLVDLHKSKL
jgi:hypothetical protein